MSEVLNHLRYFGYFDLYMYLFDCFNSLRSLNTRCARVIWCLFKLIDSSSPEFSQNPMYYIDKL